MADAVFSGTTQELQALIARLPRILAGLEADPLGIARSLQLRIGVAALSRVQQDFVIKSRGGTGTDGVKWKPLKRATIAARPITAGERKAAGIKGKRTRGLLTASQDKRWRQLFAVKKAWLMARGMGAGEASGRAAAIAWTVLKSEGAQTKLAVFGGRTVEMLRSSGRLFRSLTPGVEDRPYKGRDSDAQVFQVQPGKVIVGTNVAYAGKQNATRQFLPKVMPVAWWPPILLAARRGVARIVALMLGGRLR